MVKAGCVIAALYSQERRNLGIWHTPYCSPQTLDTAVKHGTARTQLTGTTVLHILAASHIFYLRGLQTH